MRTEAKRFDAFVSDLQKISERHGIWLQVVGGIVFSENANLCVTKTRTFQDSPRCVLGGQCSNHLTHHDNHRPTVLV